MEVHRGALEDDFPFGEPLCARPHGLCAFAFKSITPRELLDFPFGKHQVGQAAQEVRRIPWASRWETFCLFLLIVA